MAWPLEGDFFAASLSLTIIVKTFENTCPQKQNVSETSQISSVNCTNSSIPDVLIVLMCCGKDSLKELRAQMLLE